MTKDYLKVINKDVITISEWTPELYNFLKDTLIDDIYGNNYLIEKRRNILFYDNRDDDINFQSKIKKAKSTERKQWKEKLEKEEMQRVE